MIPTTDKDKIAIAHLKCPKCGTTLEFKRGHYEDYYCCPTCAGQNYSASQIIYQMGRYIDRLEKSETANYPNPQD